MNRFGVDSIFFTFFDNGLITTVYAPDDTRYNEWKACTDSYRRLWRQVAHQINLSTHHTKYLQNWHFNAGLAGQSSLVITGCGGGATHFTAHVLREMGLDAGHEEDGTDAHVGWYSMPWTHRYSGPRFVQIRNPRRVVESIRLKIRSRDQRYVRRRIRDLLKRDPFERCRLDDDYDFIVCYVYWWYKLALERTDWAYKVEELPEVIDGLLERGWDKRIDSARRIVEECSPQAGRSRAYPSWDMLREKQWGKQLHALAQRFGYT